MFQAAKPLSLATVVVVGMLSAPAASAATLVSTELFLSVDASGSINSTEFSLQKQGYVDAFKSAEIHSLIAGTPDGIAVNLQYWSTSPDTALGWFHLTDAASSTAFADLIDSTLRPNSIGSSTNITSAITSATDSILNNTFDGKRLVIDVSGDGVANSGGSASDVRAARDAAVADGITINGLPIGGSSITDYYADNIIGGEGSFNQPASDFDDFKDAVLLKLKREIVVPDDGSTSVPEPSLLLGLVGLGLWGSQTLRKRRVAEDGNA